MPVNLNPDEKKIKAKQEIFKTLLFCDFCSRKVGLSFIDENPSKLAKLRNHIIFCVAAVALLLLIIGQVANLVLVLMVSPTLADFIVGVHILGYGFISYGKLIFLWYKRHIFRQLIIDLVDIWPVDTDDDEAVEIKKKSLAALHFFQLSYTLFNEVSVTLFYVTPIVVHLYRMVRRQPSDLGYVWHVAYPFDKHQPGYHEVVYAYEAFSGQASVFFMLSSDLLFVTMTSHISMLLRLLQLKVRKITPQPDHRCYQDIVAVVKIHQRLITYFNNLEDAFCVVNLINVLVSSIDICAVVFVVVLLEPWMDVSNKLFLMAAVTQMGIVCWYADDIYTSSVGISDGVYNSEWYKANTKCRRALLLIIARSHKPLYYTTMKFSNITMKTYASILTKAYSYFALLYTLYRDD